MDKFLKCLQFVSCSTVKESKEEANVETGTIVKDSKEESIVETGSIVKESKEEREEISKLFNSCLSKLSLISREHKRVGEIVEKIQSCKWDLRFLRMFVWSFYTMNAEVRHMWGILHAKHEIDSRLLNLQSSIQKCKQNLEERCELLFTSSTVESSLTLKNDANFYFLAAILQNLEGLCKFKTDDEIHLLNNQIETLKEKVTLLYNLFKLIPNQRADFNQMRGFNVVVHVFAQYAASLVFLYWVKAVDEDMATKLNLLLVNVLQKYNFCVPAFKDVYFRFIDETKSGRSDSLLSGQIVQSFLDLLLENLIVHISHQDFQIIQEILFFVISFLTDPPDEYVEDEELMMLSAEIDLLFKIDLHRILSVYDKNGNFSNANTCLGDFKRKAELVKGKIQQVYERTRDSFSYDFPKVNGLGYFDFLLQNLSLLKEKLKRDTDFIPLSKHLIIQIWEELMSLRPYLDDLFER